MIYKQTCNWKGDPAGMAVVFTAKPQLYSPTQAFSMPHLNWQNSENTAILHQFWQFAYAGFSRLVSLTFCPAAFCSTQRAPHCGHLPSAVGGTSGR